MRSDARAHELAQQRAPPDTETLEDCGERAFKIANRVGPGVECRERVDQDHLAVEPNEMLMKKRPHHHVFVGLKPTRHHGVQRMRARWLFAVEFERCKRKRGRAREITRHQEAAGRQQAHGVAFIATGLEIGREQPGRLECRLLVLGGVRIKRREVGVPGRGERSARALPRQDQTLR